MRIKILLQEFFYFFSVALVVFFVMELIKPRIVLAYFNPDWLILLWLIAGILVLFFSRSEK